LPPTESQVVESGKRTSEPTACRRTSVFSIGGRSKLHLRVPPYRLTRAACNRASGSSSGPPQLVAARRGLPPSVTGESFGPLRAPLQGRSTVVHSILAECVRRQRGSRAASLAHLPTPSLSALARVRSGEEKWWLGLGRGRDQAFLFLQSTRTIVQLRSMAEESRS
jgi:hypothetical protein